MKFTYSIARLLEEEIKGATVKEVSTGLSIGCIVTIVLKDGREARLTVDEYHADLTSLKGAQSK